MTAELKVEGLRELQDQMKRLGGPIARRLRSNALRAGARVAAKKVKQSTPVRKEPGAKRRGTSVFGSKKTGGFRLASRVTFPGNLRDRTRVTRVKQSDTDAWIGIKSDSYGRYVEYGTPRRIFPRKFAEYAVGSVMPQVLKKVADNAKKGIERELKKRRAGVVSGLSRLGKRRG